MHASGAWDDFARTVAAGITELERREPPRAEVDAEAERFRRERKLLAADDLTVWLEQRGITLQEWFDVISRRVALRRADRPHADRADIGTIAWAEGIVGPFPEHARRLARRLAVAEASGDIQPSEDDVRRAVDRVPDVIALPRLEIDRPRDRAEPLARAWLVAEHALEAAITEAAVREEIARRRLDWLRIDAHVATFPDEDMAREAVLVVTEDGHDLTRVTAEADVPVEHRSVLLEDADPAFRTLLVSARPGEVLGPITAENGYVLLAIRDRVEPTAGDPAIERRARDTLATRMLDREESRRVRWHEHL